MQRLQQLGYQLDNDFTAKLIEELPDAIVIINTEGNIQIVNRQAEFLFGYHRAEMIGKTVDMLVPTSHTEQHAGYRKEFVEDPRVRPMAFASSSVQGQRKNGDTFECEINLSPIQTTNGLLIVATVRKSRNNKNNNKNLN